MQKYDPKRKQYVKKLKLYNIGPLATVENIDKLETGMDVLMAAKKDFNDKWCKFIQNYMLKCNFLPFPFEEQLQILILILNESIRTDLLKKLKAMEDYNPNTDPIPFDRLPSNLITYIEKKQKELIKIKEDIKENLFVEKNVIGIYTTLPYSEELLSIYKHLKIDIIIFSNEKLKISFSDFEQKFYEIQGKNINKQNIFEILQDYGGVPTKENDIYVMLNNIEKGELIEIIKTNISK